MTAGRPFIAKVGARIYEHMCHCCVDKLDVLFNIQIFVVMLVSPTHYKCVKKTQTETLPMRLILYVLCYVSHYIFYIMLYITVLLLLLNKLIQTTELKLMYVLYLKNSPL